MPKNCLFWLVSLLNYSKFTRAYARTLKQYNFTSDALAIKQFFFTIFQIFCLNNALIYDVLNAFFLKIYVLIYDTKESQELVPLPLRLEVGHCVHAGQGSAVKSNTQMPRSAIVLNKLYDVMLNHRQCKAAIHLSVLDAAPRRDAKYMKIGDFSELPC